MKYMFHRKQGLQAQRAEEYDKIDDMMSDDVIFTDTQLQYKEAMRAKVTVANKYNKTLDEVTLNDLRAQGINPLYVEILAPSISANIKPIHVMTYKKRNT
jgi:hypothetical protein